MSELTILVEGLTHPDAYPHPADAIEHIETHISHVFLVGDYAYKLKKPIDLGFLDFSTLDKRRHFCEEELRINRRLAPTIYLGVEAVCGELARPRVGGTGPLLDYVVKMRRFDQDALLTRRPIGPALGERIAERVAAFHARIPAADAASAYGSPELVARPIDENYAQIRVRSSDRALLARLDVLKAWTDARLAELSERINQRKRTGHVRECHGDLHRGNIALIDDEPLMFDAIDFNPQLRWIDTISEIAFLIMDLDEAGEQRPSRAFLNRYLELSGDYSGLPLLNLYKVYRALVRAKVTAIRLGQPELSAAEAGQDRSELERYIGLAEGYTRPVVPRLIITHGVSGSGKSHYALALRERMDLVHLRSDIERKRLFGLDAEARTTETGEAWLYADGVSARTYARLAELASTVIDAGMSPLVDATFLRASERRRFAELAATRNIPLVILNFRAPEERLRERIHARAADAREPSEATESVLEAQLARRELLTPDEASNAIDIDTTSISPDAVVHSLTTRLD